MFSSLMKRIFGTANDRRLKTYAPKVMAINALEAELAALSDADLRARTEDFRQQLAQGAKLDDLLIPLLPPCEKAPSARWVNVILMCN